MDKADSIYEALLQFEREQGASYVRQAIQRYNRKKIDAEGREPRKRLPWAIHSRLYRIQRGLCAICGEVMPFVKGAVEIDHKDPNRTEFNAWPNLQLTHKKCNREKAAKSILEQSKTSGKLMK